MATKWRDIKKRLRKSRSAIIESKKQLEEEYTSVSGLEPQFIKQCFVCNGPHFEWDCPRRC